MRSFLHAAEVLLVVLLGWNGAAKRNLQLRPTNLNFGGTDFEHFETRTLESRSDVVYA
jgi:hypothetical protein